MPKSKGLSKYVVVKDGQLLPAPDVPIELVKRQPDPDPLKACVIDLLNQGGRSEEEATAWCKDFLAMGGEDSEPESIDGANVREAERIMLDAKESLKPWYIEKCTTTRQRLFGELEFEAAKRCREDYELGEGARGRNYAPTVPTVASDQESLHQLTEMPESFKRLMQLCCKLDAITNNLVDVFHYTPEEADKKARKELGLPQVYHPKKPEPDATLPNVTGKNREQRIKESYGADADKRPGERMISPESGVPDLYLKSRKQVLKEVFEEHAEDKNR